MNVVFQLLCTIQYQWMTKFYYKSNVLIEIFGSYARQLAYVVPHLKITFPKGFNGTNIFSVLSLFDLKLLMVCRAGDNVNF